jgi:penicillin-binding protein 1C
MLEPGPIPSFAEVRSGFPVSDVVVTDRAGIPLQQVRVNPQSRRLAWTELSEVPEILIEAVIQAEDRRFYTHAGVDAQAVLAAAWRRWQGNSSRGASTVSMQVAALIDEGGGRAGKRSLQQKIRQAIRAMCLELTWSKGEILEAYLNLVPFRGEYVGVRGAARGLFGKDPHGLSAAEAVVLAAMIRAPEARGDRLGERALRLAERLPAGPGSGDVERAVSMAVGEADGVSLSWDFAPHVARRLMASGRSAEGGRLRSSLDWRLQQLVLEEVQRNLLELRGRNVRDMAVLAASVDTGEVLAYVGNGGDLSSARFVDGVQARRQAGSALKPFLFAAAFEERFLTPASLLEDRPLQASQVMGIYGPENYDRRYRGSVTCRVALASSLNIPAVRVLELLGGERFAGQLRKLNFFIREEADYYGPALALGAVDVTLWELVRAYLALARGGETVELRLTPGGSLPLGRALSPQVAFLVQDILSDRAARAAGFGLQSPLETAFWTAVKTGTSKDMRDNWCVGFSSRYVVGVWAGNFPGDPMWDVSGVTGAAPVWNRIMQYLHREEGSEPPSPPPGLERRSLEVLLSGETLQEWFLAGTAPEHIRRAEHLIPVRIVYPPPGAVLALDPDAPAEAQAVLFEAHPRSADLDWELDGYRLGSAGELQLWRPTAGRHRLRLLRADGGVVDEVRFYVRGLEAEANDVTSVVRETVPITVVEPATDRNRSPR